MSTITKERVAGIASGEKCYTHDDVVELARIALASLEAKPVAAAYVINGVIEADDFASYCGHPKFQDGPIELYANPPAPVSVPDEVLKRLLPDAEKAEFWFEHDGKILFEGVKFNNAVFEACRAAMLQGAENAESRCSNSPVIPDGYCIMPLKLTADNGAKGALCGEFHVHYRIVCQSCVGEGCEDCNHTGGWDAEIPVSWDAIKRIHEAAVEACALPAAPQREA